MSSRKYSRTSNVRPSISIIGQLKKYSRNNRTSIVAEKKRTSLQWLEVDVLQFCEVKNMEMTEWRDGFRRYQVNREYSLHAPHILEIAAFLPTNRDFSKKSMIKPAMNRIFLCHYIRISTSLRIEPLWLRDSPILNALCLLPFDSGFSWGQKKWTERVQEELCNIYLMVGIDFMEVLPFLMNVWFFAKHFPKMDNFDDISRLNRRFRGRGPAHRPTNYSEHSSSVVPDMRITFNRG